MPEFNASDNDRNNLIRSESIELAFSNELAQMVPLVVELIYALKTQQKHGHERLSVRKQLRSRLSGYLRGFIIGRATGEVIF